MRPLARLGDDVVGGVHCHGHPGGLVPIPTPGQITQGSSKVFADGKPVARAQDQGRSNLCCAGIGTIVLMTPPGKVFIDGRPAAAVGDTTMHCGMSNGSIAGGSSKISIP
jgi:uncharacterized Zn-binding protein involved in type VI secretion